MRYYKQTENNYIHAIGTGTGGEEITQSEYENILFVIRSAPVAVEGYQYKLKHDLTWELTELPREDDPDLSDAEAMDIILGVGA